MAFAAIILTADEARAMRSASERDGAMLDPVLIRGGDAAGSFALPQRVLDDPAFADIRETLDGFPKAELTLADAWPSQE